MKNKTNRKKRYKVWVEGKNHPLLITAGNPSKARHLVKTSYPGAVITDVRWDPGTDRDLSYLLDN